MNLLRYVGEFKVNLSQCTKNHMVFDRVSKKTYLSEWYKNKHVNLSKSDFVLYLK